MPLQELTLWPVCPACGQVDELTGSGVELISVAEIVAQPGAHTQAVSRIYADISAVEQRMDI